MLKKETGRILHNKITLIEYEESKEVNTFFVQSGIAGFLASEDELYDLYCLLSYYYNMDTAENIVVSLK